MQSGTSKGTGISRQGTGAVRRVTSGKVRLDLTEPGATPEAAKEKAEESKKRSRAETQGEGAGPVASPEKRKRIVSYNPDQEYVRTTFQFFNLGATEKFAHRASPAVEPFRASFFDILAHPFNALVFPANVSGRRARLENDRLTMTPNTIRALISPTEREIALFCSEFEKNNGGYAGGSEGDLTNVKRAIASELTKGPDGRSPNNLCPLTYTCAPDTMFALLHSAVVHVEIFHGTEKKYRRFWDGVSVSSLRQYNGLSVMNKMTCRVKEKFAEAGEVKKNVRDIHAKMADFCLYLEQMGGLNKSQRFLHYFCRYFACTAPLKGTDPSVHGEEMERWRERGCSLFANEENHASGALEFDAEEGNYVASLLDYVVFSKKACRGGGRGELSLSKGRVVRGYLEPDHVLRSQKLLILPFLCDHFVRFYAENVQNNLFADGVFMEFTGIPSAGVQFTDGRTDMDLLCPNRVPWGNCTRSEYFQELDCTESRRSPSSKLWYTFRMSGEEPEASANEGTQESPERQKDTGKMEAELALKLAGLKLERVPAEVSVEVSSNKLKFDLHTEIDIEDLGKPATKRRPKASGPIFYKRSAGASLAQLNRYSRQWASFERARDKSLFPIAVSETDCVSDNPGAKKVIRTRLYRPAELKEPKEIKNWFESKRIPTLLKAKHSRIQARTDRAASVWSSLFDLMGAAIEETYDRDLQLGWEGNKRIARSLWRVPCQKNRPESGLVAEISKADVERDLGAYLELGVTFRWFVGGKVARHHFGSVRGPDGSEYSPIAVAFCGIGDEGGTGGHYWCQCKFPCRYGLPDALSASGLDQSDGSSKVFLDTPAKTFSQKGATSPVREWDQILLPAERVALPVENPHPSDSGIWFCYDDLSDSGPQNWDLALQGGTFQPRQYSGENELGLTFSETLNGAKTIDAKGNAVMTLETSQLLKVSREYADPWMSAGHKMRRMEQECIQRNYVSLCSASDNAIAKLPQHHDRCKIVDEWLVIAHAYTKLDSIIYVKMPPS